MEKKFEAKIQKYLERLFQSSIQLISIEPIGRKEEKDLKSFGYGKAYRIDCIRNEKPLSLVLESMSENSFGHDHFSDRAQILLWQNSVSNKLPKHVRSIDAGAFTSDHEIISAGKAEEFFVLYEFVEGVPYAGSLERIAKTGELLKEDVSRAALLADYLVEIHSVKNDAPHLYKRRIRELLGHGECIMGLIDNYPDNDPVGRPEILQQIEELCVKWRWKIRGLHYRLCQVHGDFHPWNILFRTDSDFTAIDRSRGEFGEPADDVSSMLINYLFLSLQQHGKLVQHFETLFQTFWGTYLAGTKDDEMTRVIQPFFAWRALVLSNPVWYPQLSSKIRSKLFRFIHNTLNSSEMDLNNINKHLE